MRKVYLIVSILLLSSVWLVAQTSPSSPGNSPQQPSSTDQSSPSQTSPSQTSPSTSSTTQTTTTQTTETSTGTSIEGCLSGSAGSYTLTDSTGKTYQLAGDTSKLTEHVGHEVRLTGSESGGAAGGPSSGAGAGSSSSAGGSAAGSQSTFTVQKVKMVSSSCPASK